MTDRPMVDNEESRLLPLDAPRHQELLAAILDLSWKIGPNAAAAIPALIDWPSAGGRQTEDKLCYRGLPSFRT
jgi:hypothetical protein